MGLTRFQRAVPEGRPKGRKAGSALLVLPLIVMFALATVTLGYVAYVLWPRWPAAVSADAPSLPIIVAGASFNIPPAAIRASVQRRAGTQERVDLAFKWPSLDPPHPQDRVLEERLFVTITGAGTTLPPADRLKVIYPRYVTADLQPAPEGLTSHAFRDSTPYQGEDLLVDAAAPERFAVRCSRDRGPRTRGTCLYDRRIGDADVTFRFPRAWLDQWRSVATSIDRLIATLHPGGPGDASTPALPARSISQ